MMVALEKAPNRYL